MAGLGVVAALELSGCQKASQRPAQTAAAPPAPKPPPPPPPFTSQDVAAALAALKTAPDHGFEPARFDTTQIERLLASASATDQAEGKRQLRLMVIDYARAQHGLTIPVGALPRDWNQRPSNYDAESELNAAVRGGTLPAWLEALPPQTPEYAALQTAYVAAKEGRADHSRPRIKTAPLDLGEQDARTKALRRRLAQEDPALADVDPEEPVDQDLIDAVKAYQTRHHLDATGVLDDATAEQLNTPVLGKTAKLRINLERLRWLPRPVPDRRIDVNIAAAQMYYYRDGDVALHMLTVSGKTGDETPLVSSAIDSIVLNPPWYVPPEIAHREIIPKGSAYMQSRHFVWKGGRLIQEPGPKSALGQVKFDFPNPYAVYLHDTPSRATFSQAQRAASHGCVRLEHALELARMVVAEEPNSSANRVDKILASGKTARLKLSNPIPVRLFYLTAEAKDGTIVYLPDVYGWDPKLLALLDRYGSPRRKSQSTASPLPPRSGEGEAAL
jgi:murein L,D-transpeptidase YcbB/YkuD